MKRFWIKLWLDFLEDNKLLILDEVYQLRFIKLCLLSAKLELNGMLPPVETVAFWLRLTPKQVDLTMSVLSKCGVVSEKSDENWFVVNFQKRQAALSGTDRSKLSRSRINATNLQRKCNETLQSSVPLSSVPLSSVPLSPDSSAVTFDSEAQDVKEYAGSEKLNSRKLDSKRDMRIDHPAIVAYKAEAHLSVPITWRDEVITIIGDEPEAVESWGKLIHDWIGFGWNKQNLRGLLDAFIDGGIKDRRTQHKKTAMEIARAYAEEVNRERTSGQ